MAHEFGHALGLPDLYDVAFGDPQGDSAGIGGWGLMGWGAYGWSGTDGPVGFSAWSLEQLGWIGVENERLVEVRQAQRDRPLADLFAGGQVLKIYLPPQWNQSEDQGANKNRFRQSYLLLEHRLRGSHNYQRQLPAEGLLVWHVQPGLNNMEEENKLVDLVCADGQYHDAGFPLGRIADPLSGRDNLDFWAHDAEYALKHGGNKGDATDPFDGNRYTTFNLASNPTSQFYRQIGSGGPTHLAIDMRRQGDRMRLDIEPPRWAGTLTGDVHWFGHILVDGDLQIAPEGRLFIHRKTQVFLGPGDRMRGGLDPERVEVTVRGQLEVDQMVFNGTPVVFQAAAPGDSWFGLVYEPDGPDFTHGQDGSFQWREALHGLVTADEAETLYGAGPRKGNQDQAGAAELFIEGIENVDPVQASGPLSPRVLVANKGPGDAVDVRLVHQILRAGTVLRRVETPIGGLAGQSSQLVELPRWVAPEEGDYSLTFALAAGPGEAVGTADTLTVRLADVQGGFAPSGPALGGQGNGVAFFDYDGDGDLDLYLVRLVGANQLLHNSAGRFVELGHWAGLDDKGVGRGLAIGDYDGDGDLDLYLVNEGANRFLANKGKGHFADMTTALDLGAVHLGRPSLGDTGSGHSAGFFDHDDDGDLDLYLVNHDGPNRHYVNYARRFIENAAALGLDDGGHGRGVAMGDYDGDGDTDLFVANQGLSTSQLYRNDGRAFTPMGYRLGLAASGTEVAALFGDYDNDGKLDLFVSHQRAPNRLWRNVGARGFVASAQQLGGSSVGAAFLDYDNDGDLDLATTGATLSRGGDQLYHNRGSDFVPVGELLGLRLTSAGRAIGYGDYDGDGRQDLAVADQGRTSVYRNVVASAHWLQVDLQGQGQNPNSLGARVELQADGIRQVRELQSSYGYGSQTQPRLHFGLGNTNKIDLLRVTWPNGVESVSRGVAVNRRLVLDYPWGAAKASEGVQAVSQDTQLGANYPNPFNASTVIPFRLQRASRVQLDIYGATGQRVRRLVDEGLEAGGYQIPWDGLDQDGRSVASGVYLYRLQADGRVEARKLILVR
ncbi:MAG: T9SS type A sorting domain-containing protein [Candidatus Latescibacteria bacterium]|nr:T9SS type A sorting domain-containing protein [Candidatus Latescibacterota bacterium]